MSKSENLLAFEAALKESKELQEKFTSVKARIFENKEGATNVEMLIKAVAEVGYTLTEAELACVIADEQDLNEEELNEVAGGVQPIKFALLKDSFSVGTTTSFETETCTSSFWSYHVL